MLSVLKCPYISVDSSIYKLHSIIPKVNAVIFRLISEAHHSLQVLWHYFTHVERWKQRLEDLSNPSQINWGIRIVKIVQNQQWWIDISEVRHRLFYILLHILIRSVVDDPKCHNWPIQLDESNIVLQTIWVKTDEMRHTVISRRSYIGLEPQLFGVFQLHSCVGIHALSDTLNQFLEGCWHFSLLEDESYVFGEWVHLGICS